MPAEWFPGAVRMPGRNAGWAAGQSAMRAHVHHYTVGVNSTGIGLDGYFTWLMPKHGAPIQFAEASAVTWHCGEGNGEGPGTELERLGDWEPATPDQIRYGGEIDRWLRDEWGIDDTYTGQEAGRFPPPLYGFVNHRNIQQSQGHTDYWSDDEVARMRGASTPKPPPVIPSIPEDHQMLAYQVTDAPPGGHTAWLWYGNSVIAITNEIVSTLPNDPVCAYAQVPWSVHEAILDSVAR